MKLTQSFGLRLGMALLALLGTTCLQAQSTATQTSTFSGSTSRLAGDWRSTPAVVLAGSGPTSSRVASDLGAVSQSQRLGRMILLLRSSSQQQQALATELAGLQSPSSGYYHQWLTPAGYANAYANSAEDVAQVAAWLQSEGFTVAATPAGRGWIEFSGTAG